MSSLSANSSNIKSVMRTALVGIKPADQVMLKGYLRVLLRLEADLEWVSANHPEVDLFMINNDFKQSANIIKLLQTNLSKPVLYIGASVQGSDGRLNDDLLTLPLKDMRMLNEWLFGKVGVLQSQDNAMSDLHNTADKRAEQRSASEASQQATQSNTGTEPSGIKSSNASLHNNPFSNNSIPEDDASLPSSTSSNSASGNSATSDSASGTSKSAQAPVATDSSPLLSIIQNMRKGVSGRYQLSAINEVFAIIEPSKGLIWTKKSTQQTVQSASLVDWKVEPTSTSPSSVAHDLKQWLWEISKDKLNVVYPFIDAKRSYRLSYWVKPISQDKRSDLLRVMTAMEADAKTPQQIAEVSDVSISDVQQVVAGLFFAGYLSADCYENIKVIQSNNQSTNQSYNQSNNASTQIGAGSQQAHSAVEGNSANETNPVEQANQQNNQEHKSPLDAVLSKRAAGEAASNQTSSSIPSLSANATGSNAPKNMDAKPEKKGFLSRLRKKLGL